MFGTIQASKHMPTPIVHDIAPGFFQALFFLAAPPKGGRWANRADQFPGDTTRYGSAQILTCRGSGWWGILVNLLGFSSSRSCLPVAPVQAMFWQMYSSPSIFFCFCWTGFDIGFGKQTCCCAGKKNRVSISKRKTFYLQYQEHRMRVSFHLSQKNCFQHFNYQ